MGWSEDQDEALAELLDPPLSRPLFPSFPGRQAIPYADLEPKPAREIVGLRAIIDWDDYMHPVPAGSWLTTSTNQSRAQARFDELVADAQDHLLAEMIRCTDLQIYPEPKPATVKITDIVET